VQTRIEVKGIQELKDRLGGHQIIVLEKNRKQSNRKVWSKWNRSKQSTGNKTSTSKHRQSKKVTRMKSKECLRHQKDEQK
jgi:hypothetical protein